MGKGAAFTAGLFLGSIGGGLVAFFVTRKKYKQLADDEIESVRTVYKKYFAKEIENEMKSCEEQKDENAPVEVVEEKTPSYKATTLTMYETITEQQYDELSYTLSPQIFKIYPDGDTDAPRTAVENATGMTINDILEYLNSNDLGSMYVKNNVQESVIKIEYVE